jgi:hypothetical protein
MWVFHVTVLTRPDRYLTCAEFGRSVMVQDIDRELRELKQQLALLKDEHARTRNGWSYFLQTTGLILVLYGVSIFLGVLESRYPTSPPAMSLAVLGIFMLVIGAWLIISGMRRVAEWMMTVASRYRW